MKHIDAPTHVQGLSTYLDDVPPPADMLYATVFGSPIAHGKLVQIDVSDALDLEGVVAIFTAADIPGENQIGGIIEDEPLLADGVVHFRGQAIAIVVATSRARATYAAELIEVEIEPLPIITDPREAFDKGEIIGPSRTFSLGDIDNSWNECAFIVKGECDIRGQEHLYLETHRARAIPQDGGARMQVFSSTQGPFNTQKTIARVLGRPYHEVEVDVKRLGGGFGGKEDQASIWASVAAVAADNLGVAIEIVLTREEDLWMSGKRHPYKADFKLGADKNGKFIAYEASFYQDAGAAADLSPAVLERTLFHATASYFIPNVKTFAVSCRTNLPPNTAFRGFGGPQGMFVMESAINKLAGVMKMSSEEIQYKNLLSQGDAFSYGQTAEEPHAKLTWDVAAERFDLARRRDQINAFNQTNKTIKKGFAVMPLCFGISFTATFLNQAGALVHVYNDGSVSVSTGGVEMGQGLITNLARIAAKAFGIKNERIRIESTNTTRIANMSPTAASATTDLNGNATRMAADEILGRLKEVAAKELGVDDVSTIEIKDEIIYAGGEETALTWENLVMTTYFDRVSLSAHAFYATPNVHFDKETETGRPFAYHSYGVALVEVSVDGLRGNYSMDAVEIVHDLGRPINPLIDLGQIEGGLAQGLGWMTMEDLQYNTEGRLLSSALATYKVPDGFFMPEKLDVHFLEESDNPYGPYGSKAVGEPPLMYGIGAYFALRDAIRQFDGRSEFDLPYNTPMTPERVMEALYPGLMDQLAP